jgi:alpha-beta hydrolase superfamily lysophospholipase
MITTKRKIIKWSITGLLVVFVLMNVVAYFHAAKFTRFDQSGIVKTKDARELSFGHKLKILFLGISNPRPENREVPARPFKTVKLKSNREIECWLINTGSTKGTVIIFHGFAACKSTMLDKAEVFMDLGYNTMLVDFMGSGGSEGNETTVGFYEAEQVKTAFTYLQGEGEKNIILFGTSMGSAAMMKALSDHRLQPAAVIIECPFGTMLETVQARFKTMHVQSFPMANLLVFWGGFQNDFNAFKHNPDEYARGMHSPTLLLYGEMDEKVSREETDRIFLNIPAKTKQLETYPLAAHENYLKKYKEKWTADISGFLSTVIH